MADFKTQRARLLNARQRRDAADDELRAARARLAQVRARLAALGREGRATSKGEEGRELLRAEETLTQEIEESAALVARHESAVAAEINSLFKLGGPQRLASAMNDALPCLLLPVRLETKFMTSPTGARELWVRIFPDDIAVETHEEPLTEGEVAAGQIFWEETWRAGGDAAREEAAWRALVSKFGAARAAWVAKALEPAGQPPSSPLPEGAELEPPPSFPVPAPNESAWSRAPRTRVMPDCFVVAAYIGGAKMHEVVGRPVPDPLVLGPDPNAVQGFDETETELRVDPALEWLTDFDRAEEVGMAVRVPLNADEAERGFDRVIALGLRFSSDPADAQKRVEQLFDSHHYTDGLAVVRQGTPTNNTEAAGAGARRALADARVLLEAKAAGAAADPVSLTACRELRQALLAASLFGLPEAVPATAVEATLGARDALVTQAAVGAATLAAREREADALLAAAADALQTPDARAESYSEAARAIFGRSFRLLPRFTPQNAAELRLAVASSASLLAGAPPLAVEEWLQGLTKVRPKLAAYDAARVLADAFGHAPDGLTPVQLPHEANARWLALELAPGQEVAGDRLLLAMQFDSGYQGDAAGQSGLLVDEWVETIPNREETTGVVFHFDRPNTEPPQTLLLAVTPQLTGGWQWDDLLDTLNETLDLAKKRAVEPDALARTGYTQLLPALMTAVTRHLTTISLDFAMNLSASLYKDAE